MMERTGPDAPQSKCHISPKPLAHTFPVESHHHMHSTPKEKNSPVSAPVDTSRTLYW